MISLIISILAMGFLVFGGGQVFIPFMQDMFVNTGIATQELFIDIIALANAFPGPFSGKVFTYFTVTEHGWLFGIAINLIFAIPAVVMILLATRFYSFLKTFKPFWNLTKYIKSVIIVLLGYTTYNLVDEFILGGDLKLYLVSGGVIGLNIYILNKFKKLNKVIVVACNVLIAMVIL